MVAVLGNDRLFLNLLISCCLPSLLDGMFIGALDRILDARNEHLRGGCSCRGIPGSWRLR